MAWPSITEGVTKATKAFFESIFSTVETEVSTERTRAEAAEASLHGLYRNITEFGAIGTADDTAVFKTAVKTTASEGKTLLLPPTPTITISTAALEEEVEAKKLTFSNVHIVAPSGAVLKHKAKSQLPLINTPLGGSPRTNWLLEGITFEGNAYDARTTVVSWEPTKKELTLTSTAEFGVPSSETVYGAGVAKNPITMKAIVYLPKEGSKTPAYVNIGYTGISGNILTGVTETGGNTLATLLAVETCKCDGQAEKIGLMLANVEGVTVRDCIFKKFMTSGATLPNTRFLRFEKNRIEECSVPYAQNGVDVKMYEPAATEYGEMWVKDNFVSNCEQSGIIVTCNPKTGFMGDHGEKSQIRIVGNLVFNTKYWAGIDCEAGWIEDVLIEGNQVFGCQTGIGISHGNEPSETTVKETKTLKSGETLEIQNVGVWYGANGELRLQNAAGERKFITYASYSNASSKHVFTNVTLSGEFAIESGVTKVVPAGDSDLRAIVRGNIVDGTTTFDGRVQPEANMDIKAAGSYITIEGNQIRTTCGRPTAFGGGGQSCLLSASNTGTPGRGNKFINNTIVVAKITETETGRAVIGVNVSKQIDVEVAGNTFAHEVEREETVGKAGVAVSLSAARFALVRDNVIQDPGTGAAIEVAGGCYDVMIRGNRVRWTGGEQYTSGVKIANGGGQFVGVVNNSMTGWATEFIKDEQNAKVLKVKNTAAVANKANLATEGVTTGYPVNGGRLFINESSKQQQFASYNGTSNTFVSIEPGGSFTAGAIVEVVANSVTVESGNVATKGGVALQPHTVGVFGRKETWGSAAPTEGTWAIGDICWNTAPTATSAMCWICTTAGAPGVWTESKLP